jgi:putative colanic acid biosysnthesis UDP-glucose lipid carrier transferase
MRSKTNNIRVILLIVDMLLLNISLIIAYYYTYPHLSISDDIYYLNLILFINIDWIVCTYIFGSYKIYRVSSIEKILRSVFQAIFLHILLVTAFWVLVKGYYYSRQILISTYIIFTVSILIWRIANHYYQMYLRKLGHNLRKVVIVGYGESAIEMASFFRKNPQFGYKFIGFFDDTEKNNQVIGSTNEVKKYTLENNIDEIYCLVPTISESEVTDLMNFGENNVIRVKIIPDIKAYFYTKSKVDFYGSIPVLLIKEEPLDNEFHQTIKRLFDIVFSLMVILFFFSWFFPLIALLIKIDSRGPVFFLQRRSGKDYKPFDCLKFRSMRFEKNAEFKQASKNDDRITKLGAFLRKSSIDEMPQFFNVLLGDMSVVGPRPHPLKLDDEYKNIIEKYMSRHFVKPGVTGLSQVMGYRGETNEPHLMKARVKIDNFYIENWSFFLDIKIIFLTVYNVIKGDDKAF